MFHSEYSYYGQLLYLTAGLVDSRHLLATQSFMLLLIVINCSCLTIEHCNSWWGFQPAILLFDTVYNSHSIFCSNRFFFTSLHDMQLHLLSLVSLCLLPSVFKYKKIMNGPILQYACSNLATYSDWMFIISFRFLEAVLASTFNLFSTSSDPEFESSELQFLTPLHFLALVDPRATWFKKWMVSSDRVCLFQIEAGVQRTSDE